MNRGRDKKENCWEFKECGRERGGKKTKESGICPASTDDRLDGVHSGKNAGRSCWVVAGTMCRTEVQGTFAQKYKDCAKCSFYLKVREEEGEELMPTIVLLDKVEE